MKLPFKGYNELIGEGRNWLILVFSLLLAFFMWSIMKLSGNYSSYIKYRLEVTTNIEGRSNTSVSDDILVIGAKATGFNILQNIKGKDGDLLHVGNVDSRHFRRYDRKADTYFLFPDDIRQSIQDALGTDIKIETLATDTLFFNFPVQSNKKVPVVANTFITYGKQFMPLSPFTLKPDSILIYGVKEVIAGIDYVTTQVINEKNAVKSITGVFEITPIEGVRFSEKEILYTQEIGRYVENVIKVPVAIANAPSYANVVIIPQEVTLRYRFKFGSKVEFSAADFAVVVQYDDILREDVVKPVLVKVPNGILQADFLPKFVECVL